MKKFLKRDLVKSIIAVGLMIFVVLSFTGCVHVAQGVLSGVVSIFQPTPTPSAGPQPIQHDGKVFLVKREQLKDRINQEIASMGLEIGNLIGSTSSNYYHFNIACLPDKVKFGCKVTEYDYVQELVLGGVVGSKADPDLLFNIIFRLLYDEEIADSMRQEFLNRLGEKTSGKEVYVIYKGLYIIRWVKDDQIIYTIMPTTEADRMWTKDIF